MPSSGDCGARRWNVVLKQYLPFENCLARENIRLTWLRAEGLQFFILPKSQHAFKQSVIAEGMRISLAVVQILSTAIQGRGMTERVTSRNEPCYSPAEPPFRYQNSCTDRNGKPRSRCGRGGLPDDQGRNIMHTETRLADRFFVLHWGAHRHLLGSFLCSLTSRAVSHTTCIDRILPVEGNRLSFHAHAVNIFSSSVQPFVRLLTKFPLSCAFSSHQPTRTACKAFFAPQTLCPLLPIETAW